MHSGAIGNNDLVVAYRGTVGTFENHVNVTEKVRVCQKRWPGALVAGGGHLSRTPNTSSVFLRRILKFIY